MKEAVAKSDINAQIKLSPAIKFNGGGHLNHSIFWCNLSPCGGDPDGEIEEQAYRSTDLISNPFIFRYKKSEYVIVEGIVERKVKYLSYLFL